MTEVNLREKPIAELVALFEDEVRHECRDTMMMLRHSEVVEEIIRRGRGILGPIAEYLGRTRPVGCVRTAWGLVLSWVANELSLFPIPHSYDDLNNWITWAENHADEPVFTT